jgi:hypothetical protein
MRTIIPQNTVTVERMSLRFVLSKNHTNRIHRTDSQLKESNCVLCCDSRGMRWDPILLCFAKELQRALHVLVHILFGVALEQQTISRNRGNHFPFKRNIINNNNNCNNIKTTNRLVFGDRPLIVAEKEKKKRCPRPFFNPVYARTISAEPPQECMLLCEDIVREENKRIRLTKSAGAACPLLAPVVEQCPASLRVP